MQAPPEAFALLYFQSLRNPRRYVLVSTWALLRNFVSLRFSLVAERTTEFLLDVVVAHLLVHIWVLRAAITDVGFAVERLVWIDQALVNHPVFFRGFDHLIELKSALLPFLF